MQQQNDEAWRRKRAIRMAVVLGLVALAFYFGFILMSVMRDNP